MPQKLTPLPDNQDRRRFQLDRFIFFTDAVFAIAITLLIIEIRVPQLEGPYSTHKLQALLTAQLPQWQGFLISFFVIGQYWTAHHSAFGYVQDYDRGLILLNFCFLMSIVVMPFTTALYSEYSSHDLPFFIYSLNVIITGLLSVGLWLRISSKTSKLSYPVARSERRHVLWRGTVVPIAFGVSILLLGVNSYLARSFFVSIFIAQFILNRVYARRTRKLSRVASRES